MPKKKQDILLEDRLKELEEIISKISTSEISLETSLELYQKGLNLYEICNTELQNYKEQILLLQNTKEVATSGDSPKFEQNL